MIKFFATEKIQKSERSPYDRIPFHSLLLLRLFRIDPLLPTLMPTNCSYTTHRNRTIMNIHFKPILMCHYFKKSRIEETNNSFLIHGRSLFMICIIWYSINETKIYRSGRRPSSLRKHQLCSDKSIFLQFFLTSTFNTHTCIYHIQKTKINSIIPSPFRQPMPTSSKILAGTYCFPLQSLPSTRV